MTRSLNVNDVLDLMLAHRSIRAYTDEPVPQDHIKAAVAAGQKAATSSNIQTYSLVHVTDPAMREAFIEISGGQEKVRDCGAFFVMCADMRRHRLLADRCGAPCEENVESFLLSVIDASLFAQNMALAFESLGWGTCFIGGIRNNLNAVQDLLDLPMSVSPLFGMTVGKPAEDPWPRPRFPVDTIMQANGVMDDEAVLAQCDAYDDLMKDYYLKRGASGRTWCGQMERFFEQPKRPHLRAFFESKGVRWR
ncbi:MAG: NADPH-dependent oxidoreductase [Phycisphaerales bacterium]|nr:NADPH-dependent oxidoreductase [Phycisphaerales bacterium]